MKTNRPLPGTRAGFTLLETAIALLILTAVVSVGALSFLHVLPAFRLQGAAWEVSSQLNEARLTALLQGVAVRWRVLPPENGRTGYVIERRDPAEGTWERVLLRRPPGVILRANNTPTFYPRGTVSHLSTIFVENTRGFYRITLAITGRVKVTKG
ncbi:MAG: hypothetical protein JW747_00680 [Candidatus Aminicenantes bacterium]|nr:hypothetical protein [Candidatus Aminicenantes bacterium]